MLEDRIRGRGRDHGADLAELIRRAKALQTQLVADDVADFVVQTTDRAVGEVASNVLDRWNSASGGRLRSR
jgi:hypothetical protein